MRSGGVDVASLDSAEAALLFVFVEHITRRTRRIEARGRFGIFLRPAYPDGTTMDRRCGEVASSSVTRIAHSHGVEWIFLGRILALLGALVDRSALSTLPIHANSESIERTANAADHSLFRSNPGFEADVKLIVRITNEK